MRGLEVDVIEVSDVVLHMAETYFDFHSCCANSGRCAKSQEEMLACRERCVDEIIALQLCVADRSVWQWRIKCHEVGTYFLATPHYLNDSKCMYLYYRIWETSFGPTVGWPCEVRELPWSYSFDKDMVLLLWVKQGRFSLVTIGHASWTISLVHLRVLCFLDHKSPVSSETSRVLRIWCRHQRCVAWSNGVSRKVRRSEVWE